jgi:hypothetical protein
VQVRSEGRPELDGAWFRAFDFKRWEYWASNRRERSNPTLWVVPSAARDLIVLGLRSPRRFSPRDDFVGLLWPLRSLAMTL